MPDSENHDNVLAQQDVFEILAERVDELKNVSARLLDAMEEQIKMVISSDADALLQATEQNVTAQQNFVTAEQKLVKVLMSSIPGNGQGKKAISFEMLKVLHPRKAQLLDAWKREISDAIDQLQLKQSQLVELLEFAQSQNASMMRSFYGLHNAKHTHYRHDGEKSAVMSGMAVNQEG